jgi:uncharacterized membrane protein YGL010W
VACLVYFFIYEAAARLAKIKGMWKLAFVSHLFGWIVQVYVGHYVYEKRKPALLDSFFQAVTFAPMFVVYESLWILFPGQFQPELKFNIQEQVRRIHKEMQAQL